MDPEQKHENQGRNSPVANAGLQDGEDSGDFNTVTLNDESLDETQYQGEKKLIEGTPDAASKNDSEIEIRDFNTPNIQPTVESQKKKDSMCDGVNPLTTKETANTSGESQSGSGASLKKNENTMEERGSVAGESSTQGEKSTDVTQNKRGNQSDDNNSLKTGEPADDTTSNNERNNQSSDSDLLKNDNSAVDPASTDERKNQCDDVKPTSTDERNPSGESQSSDDEVLKNGESTADTTSTNGRENNTGDSEKQTPETVSKGIKKPDDDSSTTLKGDSPNDPSQASEHSDMDKPEVSYNLKRLTNDDRKEDKRQEETVEDQLRQSLERNEQLLKRCNDIQKEYENIKKDYAEMERKFESISKEKEDLLVTNNTFEKERKETIQAFKDLAKKDIDNQKTISHQKTDLSDIKKRYNDMENYKSKVENQLTEEQKSWRQEKCRHKNEMEKANKAYNEVTKQLKEEQKSWTQEKSNLQKDHDAKSKRHKKEIDQANKAIGSLNQKVADREEELKKKKSFMEKLIREKKEVDDKNAKHEKYMEKLKEHIKKLTEQKIKDESEHNKKVKDLNRVIHAERDNFSGLSYQYNDLVKQIQSLQEENRSLTREKQELLLRLSKVAGANLTYNNPNIADLSDEKRPTKLAEEFSELYDNEWTDAFEDLQIENEKEKTTFMLELVMNASQLCSDISSDHGQKIKDSLCTIVLPSKPSKCSKECTDEDIIPATIAPLEETNSSTPKVVIVEDKEIEDSKQKAGNLPRTSENTFGSGKTKESKQDTTENTGNNEGGTAEKADTEQPASINEGDNKRNKKEETADGTKNPPSEDFVGRYDSDGPEQKKEHLSFTSKNTNGDVNGPGKAEQVDVGGDEDKENPEKPGKKQMLTSENTNGDEFDPHMTKVNERKTKEKEENEEEEIKATSSKHTLQGDIVGDDNKERVEKQDEKHMLLTSENTNGIEFDPNNEGLSQPENEVADSGLLSREQGSMNTNDKENDASHANKQGDAVIPGADNTPEAKNDPQSENRVQATDDKSKDITKEENTATYSAKVDDTPEAKASYKHMESEANVVKETEKEEAVKKIRLESNFEKLLQKEQKKIIMDAKKLVEQHLSEEIEKAGTDLIVQENGIDTEKQESVVNYIKKCVNICWSMHRNEPPVFVEFPDITENVVFDTNKFKPYTKSGKYIDYIVWPAVYLHEGGPLLCKGVAQGRK